MPKLLFNFGETVSSSTTRRRHYPPELNNRNQYEKDVGNA
jgi:ribosomal protein S30